MQKFSKRQLADNQPRRQPVVVRPSDGGVWPSVLGDVYAVPSFARQTGLACSSCHTVFPELTPFGRAFKLHGYTTQGMKELEEPGNDKAPPLNINRTFPLSVMLQTSITRTDTKQPGTQNLQRRVPAAAQPLPGRRDHAAYRDVHSSHLRRPGGSTSLSTTPTSAIATTP